MEKPIPDGWMPAVKMRRIIAHWTCGGHKANSTDTAHYHLLIEGDGKLVRGTNSIADNVDTSDGKYAMHTLSCNAGSIGVSMCCMVGTQEKPFLPGSAPMTKTQWDVMCRVIAELARHYGIPVTKTTVLGHGEVQANLGIRQRGKWDPMVLPWNPALSYSEVGNLLRETVMELLEPTPVLRVEIDGHVFGDGDVFMDEDGSYLRLRAGAEHFDWQIVNAARGKATVTFRNEDFTLPLTVVRGQGFVRTTDLATALGETILWDGVKRIVTIGGGK